MVDKVNMEDIVDMIDIVDMMDMGDMVGIPEIMTIEVENNSSPTSKITLNISSEYIMKQYCIFQY